MKKILAAVILLLTATNAFAQPKADYRSMGSAIPPFRIEKIDESIFTNSVLKKNKPVLLVIFSPQCDHCERALDSLQKMGDLLKSQQIVLVTQPVHKVKLQEFLVRSGLLKNPLFQKVGIDSSNLIYYIYTYGMLPQFNLYDAQHKLRKTFAGAFPMDSLKMYLEPRKVLPVKQQ